MKPAFSTVAFPDWTLPQIAERLRDWGYLGCELRSFGYGSRQFACDPALTSAVKVRGYFDGAGVSICGIATGIRFCQPVNPPVIGNVIAVKQNEQGLREAKGAVDLAISLECPYVRVFGLNVHGAESRKSAVARIAERLSLACAYARNSGVKIMIENGGDFSTAAELSEILDAVNHPLLVTSYVPALGVLAGESVPNGVNVLGEKLVTVKLKDMKGAEPVALGDGDLNCRQTVEALAKAGFKGWAVYELDRAWLRNHAGKAQAGEMVAKSSKTLFGWLGNEASSIRGMAHV